ncbi:Aspartyl protease [Pedobacter steynii]|uniref:Aspartyl protease n=1 Tax=Pedobacter steynii TaxID=430522 RepID=A0A1G9IT64_9SPHI|nr:aspartyl protease family protein [Pedobacter steynii]NQX38031.1 aspartyl protease family protein [Pedobacter steynii]SDL27984.1 Aspartyl protease [Pedobacter steynii]
MYLSKNVKTRNVLFLGLMLGSSLELFAVHDRLHSFKSEMEKAPKELRSKSQVLPDQIKSGFKFVGGLMFVEVVINGEKGLLLVDTGSNGFILLNSEYFKSVSSGQQMKGMGGAVSMDKVKLEKLEWENLKLENQSFPAFNMSQLKTGTAEKVLGLIGSSFFKEYHLMMNFAGRELQLNKKPVKSPLIKDIPPIIHLPFELTNGFPVVKANIGDKTYQFVMDTGSTDNVVDHGLENEIAAIWKETGAVNMTEGSGNGGKVRRGKLKSFMIGGLNMEQIGMGLNVMPDFDKKMNISGILGFQFLKYFFVEINYPDKTMNFYDMAKVMQQQK